MTQEVSRSGAALHGHRAGFASRVTAAVIDLVTIALLALIFVVGLALARYLITGPPLSPPTVSRWLNLTGSTGLAIAYLAAGWTIAGRTVGMQVLGLRLVDRSGRLLHPLRALLRAVLCLAFPAGLLWILVSRRNASLQDLVLRTTVIYDWTYGTLDESSVASPDGARPDEKISLPRQHMRPESSDPSYDQPPGSPAA
jgi:uncharacterized RDD family membrane protein YckC